MQVQAEVKARFEAAVQRLAERLEEDYYVLAAVLYGSVARGEPWERSDIDLVIILKDGQERESRYAWLVEDDLNISAEVTTRGEFRRGLESALQGSMTHSIRSQYRLLFSKDESITLWLSEPPQIGKHDQELQALRTVTEVFWSLDKAEKWLKVKRDLNYAFMWVLFAANSLAKVEVVLNGEAPGREALDQALKFNPTFFNKVYVNLINGPKTEEVIGEALEEIERYLDERADRLFKPILDYLSAADGLCAASEIGAYFKKKIPGAYLPSALEYLWRKGVIQKLTSPVRLTRKSQVSLDEAAYYYDKVDLSDWE